MSAIDIGVSGLLAFQRSLDVTAHNISNVATDGYSRQRAEMTPAAAQFLSESYYGNGVQVATVRRSYDRFVTTEMWGQTSAQRSLQTYADMTQRVGAPLADARPACRGPCRIITRRCGQWRPRRRMLRPARWRCRACRRSAPACIPWTARSLPGSGGQRADYRHSQSDQRVGDADCGYQPTHRSGRHGAAQ